MGDGPGKARALQTKIQGIAEVIISCPVCAVRRVVVLHGRFQGTMTPNYQIYSMRLVARGYPRRTV
jgi:hypothetical protein